MIRISLKTFKTKDVTPGYLPISYIWQQLAKLIYQIQIIVNQSIFRVHIPRQYSSIAKTMAAKHSLRMLASQLAICYRIKDIFCNGGGNKSLTQQYLAMFFQVMIFHKINMARNKLGYMYQYIYSYILDLKDFTNFEVLVQ